MVTIGHCWGSHARGTSRFAASPCMNRAISISLVPGRAAPAVAAKIASVVATALRMRSTSPGVLRPRRALMMSAAMTSRPP